MSVCRLSGNLTSAISWPRSAALAVLLSVVGMAAVEAVETDAGDHRIHALSSRPDLVSGESVLVQVDVTRNDASAQIELNGLDVTGSFHRDARTGALVGLVESLKLGANTLTLFDPGMLADSLTISDYPITGPITSGPHITPFICQTQDFVLPDGSKLGAPLDADC